MRQSGANNNNREGVWIVKHKETPPNTLHWVLATAEEAAEYADAVHVNDADGVITTEFPIGFRFEDRAARYRR